MKKETFFIKIIIGVFKEMLSKIIATIIIVIFTLIKPKFMKSDINTNVLTFYFNVL
jgi:hypothetical protein